ncbi:MAG: hypothetical protein WBF93_13970 [Pirellulales bacterium]
MPILVYAVEKPELPPLEMPARFKHDVTYFITPPGEQGVPETLAKGERWVRREDALRFYDEGVVRIVSPLDSANTVDVEITEEQELWLDWMIQHAIEHVRLE